MRKEINTNNKGDTNVKRMNIIDFSTLKTASHEDDKKKWNAFEPYGKDDDAERRHKNTKEVSSREMQRILKRASWIGQRALAVMAEAA